MSPTSSPASMPSLAKLALGLTAVLLGACATAPRDRDPASSEPAIAASEPAAAYELTFLRSNDTDPARLVAFIEANWFAMDAEAVRQGLLTSYRVLSHPGAEDDAWNVVVIVGYPSAEGYAGVQEAFEAIRAAHQTVPIDGATQVGELGRVVDSHTLFP